MIGEIKIWSANSIPSNHLKCEGQSLDTTQYSSLFQVIGYTFGGSGSSFNIPDLRERFIRGCGVSHSLAQFESDSNQSHTHAVSVFGGGCDYDCRIGGSGSSQGKNWISGSAVSNNYYSIVSDFGGIYGGSHSHTGDTSSQGSSECRPKNLTLQYIIQVFDESSSGGGLTEEQANMLQTVYDFIVANCKQNSDGSYDFTKIFPVPSQGASPYYLSDHFNYLVCKLNGDY